MRRRGDRVFECRWLFALAALVLPVWPNTARAADDELRAGLPATIRQEIVGIELTPASMAMGDSVSRFQAGPGGALRFFRHRWEHLYLVPFQAGLYVAPKTVSFAAYLQIEGGVIVPGTARRLELGVGAGTGAVVLPPLTAWRTTVPSGAASGG